jgi:hypothetical protein
MLALHKRNLYDSYDSTGSRDDPKEYHQQGMITNIQKNHEKPVILIWTSITDKYKRGRLTCE